MAAYYTSQAYDRPASFIWSVLTDFHSWPQWFPRMTDMRLVGAAEPARHVELMAVGERADEWTRWQITTWSEPALLVCTHVDSNVPMSMGVQAAYLQFELEDDDEGSTLEVELGAQGAGVLGDFFVGVTLGSGARRMLPQLIDAFSDHVVRRASNGA